MGLDMYLLAEKYIGRWEFDSAEERKRHEDVLTAIGLPQDAASSRSPGLDVVLTSGFQETESGVSPLEGPFFDALEACVRIDEPDGTVLPVLMPGASDGRYFRRMNIPTYGFAPFRVTQEEYRRIHGIDERISLDNVSFGLRFFTRLLNRLIGP